MSIHPGVFIGIDLVLVICFLGVTILGALATHITRTLDTYNMGTSNTDIIGPRMLLASVVFAALLA